MLKAIYHMAYYYIHKLKIVTMDDTINIPTNIGQMYLMLQLCAE